MRRCRVLAALLLVSMATGALTAAGCSRSNVPATPTSTAAPPAQTQPVQAVKSEWTEPFEGALTALAAMNASGKKSDLVAARARYAEFGALWARIRLPIRDDDPKLETHIGDGVIELDVELAKPDPEVRLYELDEETVKIGRLLSQAAEALGVPIRPELVQKDPSMNIPFNQEKKIAVTLTEHKIDPAAIVLEQHTKVTFVVTNRGKELHDFTLDHYAMGVEDLQPGETRELTLVVLDAGEFETACHVPGHYEVGQHGTLTVKPAALRPGAGS